MEQTNKQANFGNRTFHCSLYCKEACNRVSGSIRDEHGSEFGYIFGFGSGFEFSKKKTDLDRNLVCMDWCIM